jgi:chemotaxis response regulator CheB
MSRLRQIKTVVAVAVVAVDAQTTRQLKTDTQRMMQLQRQHVEQLKRQHVEQLKRQHVEQLQRREYQTLSFSNFSSLSRENSHIQTLANSSFSNRHSNQIRSLNRDDQLLSFELEELELQKEQEENNQYENLKLLIKASLRVDKKII